MNQNNNEVLKKDALDRLVERIFSHLKSNYFSRHGGTIAGDVDINGTLTADDIFSDGGVSAKGIADFGTPSGAGGAVGIDVVRDDELESLRTESITQVASAWSVKRIKDITNVEDIPAFNSSLSYERGDYTLHNGIAWKFIENHQGEWNSGHCKRVDLNDVLTPSNVYVEDLINKYFR